MVFVLDFSISFPLIPNVPFLYPLKTSEIQRFSGIIRDYGSLFPETRAIARAHADTHASLRVQSIARAKSNC